MTLPGQVMPLVLALVSHGTSGIFNWATAFLRSRLSKMRCNMTFWVMWHHWVCPQHHMILMALSMAPLHSLGQDNSNELQQDYFGHATPLAPVSASCDANGIVNGHNYIPKVKTIEMRSNITFWSCDATGIDLMWGQWHCQWQHCIPSIMTIKMRSNMIFWLCNATGIAWHKWHCQWHWCQH